MVVYFIPCQVNSFLPKLCIISAILLWIMQTKITQTKSRHMFFAMTMFTTSLEFIFIGDKETLISPNNQPRFWQQQFHWLTERRSELDDPIWDVFRFWMAYLEGVVLQVYINLDWHYDYSLSNMQSLTNNEWYSLVINIFFYFKVLIFPIIHFISI